ncbi:MAG: acyl-CoA dehydrogenase family protein, partial [Calditrichaeota bacterium]|nr:acyl-CoA dehydrogenase family protein [Calditrichota bacterium]
MKQFEAPDYFDLDSLLSDEEKMIRSAVREWVSERVMPVIENAYQSAKFPTELTREMAELGLFGANLPEKYGCAGVNNVAYGIMMQELERGDSGIRSAASVQG